MPGQAGGQIFVQKSSPVSDEQEAQAQIVLQMKGKLPNPATYQYLNEL
jgi:hypothetical protein